MNDPLNAINSEEVEKNVNEAFKTMHKSVRFFQEMPSKSNFLILCLKKDLKFCTTHGIMQQNCTVKIL